MKQLFSVLLFAMFCHAVAHARNSTDIALLCKTEIQETENFRKKEDRSSDRNYCVIQLESKLFTDPPKTSLLYDIVIFVVKKKEPNQEAYKDYLFSRIGDNFYYKAVHANTSPPGELKTLETIAEIGKENLVLVGRQFEKGYVRNDPAATYYMDVIFRETSCIYMHAEIIFPTFPEIDTFLTEEKRREVSNEVLDIVKSMDIQCN